MMPCWSQCLHSTLYAEGSHVFEELVHKYIAYKCSLYDACEIRIHGHPFDRQEQEPEGNCIVSAAYAKEQLG